MKNILKLSGIIFSILGVIVLFIHQIRSEASNSLLAIGLGLMLLGLIFYILLNKFVED